MIFKTTKKTLLEMETKQTGNRDWETPGGSSRIEIEDGTVRILNWGKNPWTPVKDRILPINEPLGLVVGEGSLSFFSGGDAYFVRDLVQVS